MAVNRLMVETDDKRIKQFQQNVKILLPKIPLNYIILRLF